VHSWSHSGTSTSSCLDGLKLEHRVNALDRQTAIAQRLLQLLDGLVWNVGILVGGLYLQRHDATEQSQLRCRLFHRCPFQVADQFLLLFLRSLRARMLKEAILLAIGNQGCLNKPTPANALARLGASTTIMAS
jgi:hypothetical protein